MGFGVGDDFGVKRGNFGVKNGDFGFLGSNLGFSWVEFMVFLGQNWEFGDKMVFLGVKMGAFGG